MSRRGSSRSRSSSRRRSMSPSSSKSQDHSPDRKRRTPENYRKLRVQHRSRESRYRSRSRSRSKSLRRYKTKHCYSPARSASLNEHRGSYERRKSYSRSPLTQRRRHIGTREHPQLGRCLGVFGLCMYTTEQKIRQLFSEFGPLESVQLVIDAKTGKSRGFCFVYFEDVEHAKLAKERCNDIEVDGRRIRVDYSLTLRAHTPTPGVYMGKPTRLYKDREYHDRYREEECTREKYRHREKYSPSPSSYRTRKRRYERSRSRSYSPRDRRYR